MIENSDTRSVRCTTSAAPEGHPARTRLLLAGLAIALASSSALAAVAPPSAPAPAATVAPVAPAPASAAPPPAAPRTRVKNAPLVPISTPPPEFPDHAKRARISGHVIVTYTIGTDGLVGNVRVVESSPQGVFDRAVQAALARWRYEPPATPREITHTFDFDQ